MDLIKYIQSRRSVRTYAGAPDGETLALLQDYAQQVENPFGISVAFRFLNAGEHGLTCPVVTGTDLYAAGKLQTGEHACVAFGYAFETLLLYAQSLGLGSVWLGGTMNRGAYEKAMELAEGEFMPCAAALGYPAGKMSARETLMRKAVKADARLAFEELFYEGSADVPLTEERAGVLKQPLQMVRLAPSAVNKQPWRVIMEEKQVHFYLRRSKRSGHDSVLDMQKIDLGIALCHFALSAEECGMRPMFYMHVPDCQVPHDWEYIASYRLGG